jgi:hypothetical protein
VIELDYSLEVVVMTSRRITGRYRKNGSRHALRPHVEDMERRTLLANFLVTTTSDTPIAPTQDVPNPLTLREAITKANATPGPNTISFHFPAKDIPGVVEYDPVFEVWTIHADSALPAITNMVAIDGYSQKVITGSQGVNAVQTITLVGIPDSGTFTLTFDAETTTPLPFNATADQVSAALQALPKIGPNNVTVTPDQNNSPINTGNLTVTFVNGLGNTAVEPITGDSSGLNSSFGFTPEVAVNFVTQGVNRDITSDENVLSPGFVAKVRVILDGSVVDQGTGANVPSSFTGLTVQSGHNIIRGLSIDGFGTGIAVQGPTSIGNLIQGNYVGQYVLFPKPELNIPDATVAGIGNGGIGVDVSSPTNNSVGGVAPNTHNGIAGNGEQGVVLEAGANGNQVVGNLIGILQQDANVYFQLGNGAEGVLVDSASNAIGGAVTGSTNVISANATYGIHLAGPGAFDNRIEANYIGTDINGTFKFGQGITGNGSNQPISDGNLRDGIYVDNAPDNLIGLPALLSNGAGVNTSTGNIPPPNVISGNFGAGVRIAGDSASGNVLQGNLIGTDVTGAAAIPNFQEGVAIFSPANLVGGPAQGDTNVISGNLRGVLISGPPAVGNEVIGNVIGTDAKGNYDIGNAQEGVRIDSASDTTVGGTTNLSRNIISGNNVGVLIIGATASENVVLGNYVGTDATGALGLGNSLEGVRIDGAPSNTVGGVLAGSRNVISANHWGVTISGSTATQNAIQGNLIGTDASGKNPLGNELDGVLITASASTNSVGGLPIAQANTIADNLRDGVRVDSGTGNAIPSNSIFGNGDVHVGHVGIGINLVGPADLPSGVTPNTPGGPHSGPNDLQNFPVLSLATSNASTSTTISGSLNSTPNTSFTIQFFSNLAADPSGFGQGHVFLGNTTVLTDSAGNASFTFTALTATAAGQFVSATATDPSGNTSEFAASIPVQDLAGSLQFSAATYSVIEGAGVAIITVNRVSGSSGTVSVRYATSDGTPGAQVDYVPTSGTLLFNDGETTKTFSIPILSDNRLEPDMKVNLTLSNPTGGGSLGVPSTAVLTIHDKDTPQAGSFEFSNSAFAIAAGSSSATITISRVGGSTGAASVSFATSNGTGIAGIDYTAVSGTLNFADGEITKTFAVPILDPLGLSADKTINLTLSNPTGGANLAFPTTATLTILAASGPNFVVTTTSDTPVAPSADLPFPLTLRQAIAAADATAGPTTISFQFPAKPIPGIIDYDPAFQVWRIHVDSALPAITGQVTIDGYSQRVLTGVIGADEIQTISLLGLPFAGTFTLNFEGQTTDPIPYNATADQVAQALQKLPSIGVGNVVVTQGPLDKGQVTVEFVKALGDTNVEQITGDPTGLITPPGLTGQVDTFTVGQGVTGDITSKQNALSVGFNGQVRVIVDGDVVDSTTGTVSPATFPGLVVQSGHNIIRGLSIDGFSTGILVQGPNAVGNLIQGNYVGRYVLFPKSSLGVSSATIAGIGNSGAGIEIFSASNNAIGGVAPETHNAIAGNGGAGVQIDPDAPGTQVVGNLIGVLQQDSTTYGQVGNRLEGVLIESPSNLIGGAVSGATNVISANGASGIHIDGPRSFDNRIEANFIGTDPGGTFIFGQGIPGNGQSPPPTSTGGNAGDGIFVDNSPGNIIGIPAGSAGTSPVPPNVISGNFGDGVRIAGPFGTSNTLQNNEIGVNLGATSALPNSGAGVALLSAGNLVGGVGPGTSNVISANLQGILISGAAATGNVVVGNIIGTDGKVTFPLGNSQEGIRIDSASSNTIGGLTSASGNVISGNNVGVAIVGATAVANSVLGNEIGTDAKAVLALGNSLQGVLIQGAGANTIGGGAPGAGNVIAANDAGVTITDPTATGNIVQGNFIGTDSSGTHNVGNELDGILVTNNAATNVLGGLNPAQGNIIANNFRDGVRIESDASVNNSILSDQIFGNHVLGIDLAVATDPPSGVTPNTPGGPHTGPNHLQNYPVLTLATSNLSASTSISGTLNSTPNTNFFLQFFSNPLKDPSGFGQGRTLLGGLNVVTDASGNAPFTFIVPKTTPAGQFVSATATDATGNTSEFAADVIVQDLVGRLQFSQPSYTVIDSNGVVTITVDRVDGSSGVVSVHYATRDLTANAETEYVPTFGTLVFNDGELVKTFNIQLIAAPTFEPDQEVNLILSNPTGGATLGIPSTDELTIRNALAPQFGDFQFSNSAYAVPGGVGLAIITVVRLGGSAGPATVQYATGNGTAIGGIDYTPVAGTLVFDQGQLSATFTVPILDAQTIISDHILNLTLFNPTGGATLGVPSTATLTILDTVGPTVRAVHLITNSKGWVTALNVIFSEPLNPTTATNLLNYGYSVRTAGHDHIFGTADDLLIPISSAVYNPAGLSVVLTLGRPIHPPTPFRFAINEATSVPGAGVGVADLAGNLLDGANNGVNGTPYIAILLGKAGGVVPPSSLPPKTRKSLPAVHSQRHPKAAAIDALLASGRLSGKRSGFHHG